MVLMKSYLPSKFLRESFDYTYNNVPQYFLKEPTLTNDSSQIEYNYFWIGKNAIDSSGATYADSEYGSNQLVEITKTDNSRVYFGQFKLSKEQQNALNEYNHVYLLPGVYTMNFYYGKNGELTPQPIVIFPGKIIRYLICMIQIVIIFLHIYFRIQTHNTI